MSVASTAGLVLGFYLAVLVVIILSFLASYVCKQISHRIITTAAAAATTHVEAVAAPERSTDIEEGRAGGAAATHVEAVAAPERGTDIEEGGAGDALEECVICKAEMEADWSARYFYSVRLSPCEHNSFHAGCVFSWLSVPNRTCPICRAVIRAVTYGL